MVLLFMEVSENVVNKRRRDYHSVKDMVVDHCKTIDEFCLLQIVGRDLRLEFEKFVVFNVCGDWIS